MGMKDRKSLLALCIERTGSHLKGARIAAFIVAWGLARQELGDSITVESYAAWWKQSRRTAFREQAEFREAFAPLETPDAVLDHMAAQGLGETVDARRLQLA